MDRVARARVLVGCWAVIGATAAGCGQSKSKGPDMTGAADAALHVISTPVSYAKVGEDLKYQAVLSQPGAADWALAAAPQGAKIDQGGSLTWTPTDDQSGPQTVAINAALAGEQVTQTAHVTAASSVVQASAHVDPASVNGALIAVDAPLSPIQGAAVQLQPGALPPGHSVAVTVASMSNAPMPAAAAVAGIPPNEMRPVDFGPSGMAFQVPAQVHLPVRPSVLKKGRPEIQTYDYDTGRWQKIKVISVDEANGFVTGEIKHFSTYVVTPPSQAFDLRLGLGGAGSACAQALVVRPALAAAFDQIPASAVNGYAGSAASVADVLAGLAGGQALQVYTRVRAQAAAATGESIAWVLASATRLADGKLKISITTDSHGGAFLTTPPELDGGDSEVPAWLSGGRVDLIFSGLGSLGGGATADADVSFYVVPAGDADHPPPAAANAFAAEEVTQPSLMPMAGFDDDCDGAPNQWDPTPQGTPPPQLTGTPQGPIHVAVGSAAAFTASAGAAGTTFTWTASDPSVAIATTMAGAAATATPGKAGHFTVDAVGSNGASSSRLHWDLYADPAAVHAANTPPVVAIGASAVTVRAGERVVLNAYGKDAEQTDLTFSWYADDTSTLSAQAGSSIVFAAVAPGDYKVGCTASDGIASSTPAALVISVLSPMANRPPSAPLVTPTSVVLQHAAGVSVALALAASAADPDGDAVTYDFVPDRFTPPTFTLTKNGGSAMFTTAQDGLYLFYVTAKDSHGAVSAWTPAKIQVLPTLPAVPVDADKDGYPAGIDCNDNDPAIHPGAAEICGDGIDQNCDGQDLGVADCDADGDRFTINQGDCDDKNAAVNPGAVERCDGIDNNCNGQVDEGFGIGVDCTAGVGACRVAATTICNAAFNGVVCGGNPGLPKPEVCDGIDNDCNGKVDDVTATAGGDVGNCGGCNIRCTAPANSVAACVKGGCTTACSPGWVDTDHNPDNGCECQITNGGVEICDGLDNDCNGSVDDGASAVFYDGATGTLGVGVCASGTRLCMGGKPVVVRAQQLPAPEICDGLDNDCNGVVDDGFDLSKDPRNCGACGIVCADGICQGGKCPGGLGGTGTGGAGGVTGADAGVRDAGGGAGGAGGFGGNGGGGSVMAICAGPTGTFCTDLGFDPGNCGACGHACQSGMVCSGGACMNGSDGTDGGTSAGNPDGATTSVPTCDATRPLACQNAAGPWTCVDPQNDAVNCGGCGRACPAGVACSAGVCAGGVAACAPPLSSCGTACTTLADDPANCGGCGNVCQGGVCGASACQPPGSGKYSDPCVANTDCGAGMMCMDEARFGWGNGFCTTPCDANRSCAAGQACVNVGAKLGNFGLCESKCTADADCPRGYLCGSGLCAPDCRSSTKICPGGQTCDATGRCVPGATMTTTTTGALAVCPGTNAAPVCTNLYYDGANCGTCGNICGSGMYCQGGACIAVASGCPAPGKLCVDQPTGKSYCAYVDGDPGNCGFCGNVCSASTYCQSGACVPNDGGASADAQAPICPDPMTKVCPIAAGGYYCALVMNDPANCGACGNACPQGSFCQNFICTATDGGASPACSEQYPDKCPIAGGGGSYCTNLAIDPGNCGVCGAACPGGQACNNATCVPAGGPDGGVAPADGGAT